MRHGRPNVPPNPLLMTKWAFNEYLHKYDEAGLSTDERTRLEAIYAAYPVPDLVVTSDLPRARETADLFGRGAPLIEDPIFREIPIKIPEEAQTWFLATRWPSEMWWSYLRTTWFFDVPPEGQKKSRERSRQAALKISQYQDTVNRLAVVSHSGFILVMIDWMIRQGWIEGRRLPHIGFGTPTEYHWR